MNNSSQDSYSEVLAQLEIEHSIMEHPHLVSPSEVLQYLGLELADGISNILMKASDDYFLITRRDDCRFDSKKIKQLTGSKSLRMATPEEFVSLTNLPVGAARQYIPGFPTFIDKKVLERDYVIGGSGSFTQSIRYKASDLHKIPGSKVVDVSKSE